MLEVKAVSHPRPTSTSEPSGLHPRFQVARCSSSVAQCPWTIQLCSDWDCSTPPDVLLYSAVVSTRVLFPSETNLNPRTLWTPPLVPTGAVLIYSSSLAQYQSRINKLMPLVRLRFCQCWSSTPVFLLVPILTETYLLVTTPFSTRWSPPELLTSSVAWCSSSVAL